LDGFKDLEILIIDPNHIKLNSNKKNIYKFFFKNHLILYKINPFMS